MRTRSENAIELVVFDIAEELELSDAEVHRLDLERITATVLSSLREELLRDARGEQAADRTASLVAGLSDAACRLVLRFREGLVG